MGVLECDEDGDYDVYVEVPTSAVLENKGFRQFLPLKIVSLFINRTTFG